MRYWIVLALMLLLAGCGKKAEPLETHAVDISWRYESAAPDFALQDPSGRVRRLSDFRGKVVLLFFGYTHCPEVCPTTLADTARVLRELGPEAGKVQVLFVTLDPERDTAEVLSRYAPAFSPSFIGLRGDAEATAAAASAFAVSYEKHQEKNGYSIDHTDATFIVSPDGRTVLMSPYAQRTDFLLADVKRLLSR